MEIFHYILIKNEIILWQNIKGKPIRTLQKIAKLEFPQKNAFSLGIENRKLKEK